MPNLWSGNVVDFRVLDVEAVTMYGSAVSVGAFHVKNACINRFRGYTIRKKKGSSSFSRLATASHSKEGCLQAFNDAKREFAVLKPHFDSILSAGADFHSKWEHVLRLTCHPF